jgi:hypothetical protein
VKSYHSTIVEIAAITVELREISRSFRSALAVIDSSVRRNLAGGLQDAFGRSGQVKKDRGSGKKRRQVQSLRQQDVLRSGQSALSLAAQLRHEPILSPK